MALAGSLQSIATCDGGIYVGSSQVGIDGLDGAAPNQIGKPVTRFAGHDLGANGFDHLGFYFCVCSAAGARQVAVWQLASRMGFLFSIGGAN
jgi:hypothetical protein